MVAIDPDMVAKILEMTFRRVSIREIADEVGCSMRTVCRYRELSGIYAGYDKLDYDRMEKIVRMTTDGYSTAQIAHRLQISTRTVCKYRSRAGIAQPMPPAPMTPEVKAKCAAMLDDGMSYKDIAATVGVSPGTVAHHFPGRGWTPSQVHAHRMARIAAKRKGIDL